MSRFRSAALIALATASAGVVAGAIPAGAALEDTLGLEWLFAARGPVAPPPDVVIVSIDEATAAALDLPADLRQWPRATHARLLDRLAAHGASAIGFDIAFLEHRDDPLDDEAFAEAIERTGRAVLVDRIDSPGGAFPSVLRRRKPIERLEKAARMVAAVPVPEVPPVNGFWTFVGDGDLPTLPAALVQVHGLPALEPFQALLRRSGVMLPDDASSGAALRTPKGLADFMRSARRALRADPLARDVLLSLAAGVQTADGPRLRALASLFTTGDAAYLSFYGPPGTICSIPYELVLTSEDASSLPCNLREAIVLVGAGADRSGRTDRPDTYPTVIGGRRGEKMSGVEIHATAVANLLTHTALELPGFGGHAVPLLVCGAVLGALGYVVRTRRRLERGAVKARLQAVAALAAACAAYAVLVVLLFQSRQLMLPIVVPLVVQLPVAAALALLMRPVEYEDSFDAVCLASDAEGSTAIGQALPHAEYARLMREYHAALCAPVSAAGGITLEPQGDGFVCLWCLPAASSPNQRRLLRLHACSAALVMSDVSGRFNAAQPLARRLPTRIGLNLGPVTVHSDADRGIFKAFGDTVNVAARLRDLNVQLGTTVLASSQVTEGLEDVLDGRAVPGTFALKGVSHPIAAVVLSPGRSGTSITPCVAESSR